MLAAAVDHAGPMPDDKLLNKISDDWIQLGHWNRDPDEHFLIVNNVDSQVILDTVYRGRVAGTIPFADRLYEVAIAAREQMGNQMAPVRILYSDISRPGGVAHWIFHG